MAQEVAFLFRRKQVAKVIKEIEFKNEEGGDMGLLTHEELVAYDMFKTTEKK